MFYEYCNSDSAYALLLKDGVAFEDGPLFYSLLPPASHTSSGYLVPDSPFSNASLGSSVFLSNSVGNSLTSLGSPRIFQNFSHTFSASSKASYLSSEHTDQSPDSCVRLRNSLGSSNDSGVSSSVVPHDDADGRKNWRFTSLTRYWSDGTVEDSSSSDLAALSLSLPLRPPSVLRNLDSFIPPQKTSVRRFPDGLQFIRHSSLASTSKSLVRYGFGIYIRMTQFPHLYSRLCYSKTIK